MTYRAALAHLRGSRPVVSPNAGFAAQLQEFERRGADASRWGGWRQIVQARAAAAAAAAGAGEAVGAEADCSFLEPGAHKQYVVAIPPPVDVGPRAGGCVEGVAGAGLQGPPPPELLDMSQLRVDGSGASDQPLP
ncbi:hypothetical protein MNEG_10221 [Monoraphidium neglectum]|uniref:Uncharacterized protein n=1 Tax=Monoraphidium neglectum TaxID=145388 RepID=A0A0D2M262_9CHLO|nr:hypothetical protein MNEG_10221 [Monoraphidium neglectum]KIY97739.1 hypothetical protein MNEG_10221 [Monoraphidium neglectum]|eukprot:XP_013896759.1 hypothetical protein MNEG_10221 [Monoraphidium neglectum]